MKHFVIVLSLALIAFSAHAQTKSEIKIAYFDKDSLLKIMPDYHVAIDSAQKYYDGLIEQLNELTAEMSRVMYELDSLSPDNKKKYEDKVLDITELQKRIEEYQQGAQEEYVHYREKLLTPVFEKINNSAKAIAIRDGYNFVLDSSKSARIVIYANSSYDIFNDMCKELGIVRK